MHKWQYVPPDCRLATRKPDLGDALGDEKGREVCDFRGGKEVIGRREWDSLFGHAVETSEVAAFRETDAEVVMFAVVGIRQKR